ncbi:EAL domain-containing protein [Babesia caballi]|uniref:EAL domain-containing protein n=1 Tax=Babesia caballi TaxID=5871 RepID=A0AAV4LUW0_BABCB|nr:EAL domain-containing protein [Babesia caballi]
MPRRKNNVAHAVCAKLTFPREDGRLVAVVRLEGRAYAVVCGVGVGRRPPDGGAEPGERVNQAAGFACEVQAARNAHALERLSLLLGLEKRVQSGRLFHAELEEDAAGILEADVLAHALGARSEFVPQVRHFEQLIGSVRLLRLFGEILVVKPSRCPTVCGAPKRRCPR